MSATMAEQTVQANLDAYNNRDIDVFMSYLDDTIELYSQGDKEPAISGIPAMRAFYSDLFEKSPELNSIIEKRIVIGSTVIDHEKITGRNGSDEVVELVLIYEVNNAKIFRITVIRP